MASGSVCAGDHSLDVMNPWIALTMKIRCRGSENPALRFAIGLATRQAQGRPGTPGLSEFKIFRRSFVPAPEKLASRTPAYPKHN